MRPAAPLDERCPCGSGRAFTACCADGQRAATRLTVEALTAWARERGVEEQLRVVAGILPDGLSRLTALLPRWMRGGLTVGDALVPELHLRTDVDQAVVAIRTAAWAFLLGEVGAVREGLEQEARPKALPQHPTLALVAERLRTLRAEVRGSAMPRPVARHGHCSVRVDPKAIRFSFVEHRKMRRPHASGLVEPGVVLPLAGAREGPLPIPACSCEASRPCTHVLAAIDLALAQLADPSRPITWDSLARSLDTPDWSRLLAVLDGVYASRQRSAVEAEPVRFSFRVREVGAGHVEVIAFRHKRRRDGEYGQGQRVRPGDLARGGRFAPEDRAALDRLGYLGGLASPYAFYAGSRGTRACDLLALAGHPRVFLDGDAGSAFTVKGAELGLAIRPHQAGGLEVAPTVASAPIPAEQLRRILADLGPDGAFLRVDRERRMFLVVKVSDPDAARALVAALVAHGQRFPAEAESALFERLGPLQELLPVDLPAGLEGEEVAPAHHQVLRIALREVGLELQALARPLPGAPPQPPGEGPTRLVAATPARRVFTRRDLDAERQAARDLLGSLSLGDATGAAPFRRVVGDDEAALALLELLRTPGRPDVTVEWLGPPPRVVRASRSRELRVDAAVARLAGLGEEARPEQRRFQVLAAITGLRLLACHPRLHDPECALPSSKLARFLDLAAELAEGGHRALVFSQFTSHPALVREALGAAGRSFLYLDGQTPPAQRDRLVERFQAGEGELFLISLKAGGTGLNLTAADYVVHLDPWWNPAVEDQATNRAHRIGQRRPVTVYRLLSQGTIEEAIVTLHAKKRDLVASVLDGMDAAGRLSPDDLMALIRVAPQEVAVAEAAAPSSIDGADALEVEAEGGRDGPRGRRGARAGPRRGGHPERDRRRVAGCRVRDRPAARSARRAPAPRPPHRRRARCPAREVQAPHAPGARAGPVRELGPREELPARGPPLLRVPGRRADPGEVDGARAPGPRPRLLRGPPDWPLPGAGLRAARGPIRAPRADQEVLLAFFASLRAGFRSRAALQLEALALRHQLAVYQRRPARARIKIADRHLWAWLSRTWTGWRDVLVFVRPNTVIAWQRRRFRDHWARLTQGRPGRPAVARAVQDLIRKMSSANPGWGSPRIVGELAKLGIHVAKSTVEKYMVRRILVDYLEHYHRWRCHRSLEMDCPEPRPVQGRERGVVVEVAEAGGLYRHYERRAA